MIKTKRVLLDCDGILADFVGGFISSAGMSSATPEDMKEWDVAISLGSMKSCHNRGFAYTCPATLTPSTDSWL